MYCPYWLINCCDGIPLQYGVKNEFTGDICPISGQNTTFVEEVFENERAVPFHGWKQSSGFGSRGVYMLCAYIELLRGLRFKPVVVASMHSSSGVNKLPQLCSPQQST